MCYGRSNFCLLGNLIKTTELVKVTEHFGVRIKKNILVAITLTVKYVTLETLPVVACCLPRQPSTPANMHLICICKLLVHETVTRGHVGVAAAY